MATHFHRLRIKDIRTETPECISIAFELPEALQHEFAFIQGQNLTLRIQIDKEEIRRSYSICSSPLDNELRIAVKKIQNGKFSAYVDTLAKGAELEVLAPTGKFYTALHADNKKDYVAFAAGSGITPIMSIIKTTLAQEPSSSFTLVFGNKNRHSIIFKDKLEALKNLYIDRFALHYVFSQETTEAPINHGRITKEKCEQFTPLIDFGHTDEFFICGPEEMIFSIKAWLETKGIEKNKIHFELFTVPGQGQAGKLVASALDRAQRLEKSKVTIRQDGIAFSFDLAYDDLPILHAALQRGADLPFACKGGVCGTCRARLVEGSVEMEHNYALEPDELENGFVLTCQSHPRSEKITVDFDAK